MKGRNIVQRVQYGRLSLRMLGIAVSAVLVTCAPAAASGPPPDLDLELVAGGFTRPVVVTHAGDGSGRLFVVEQAGRIKIIRAGAVLGTDFLDITSQVDSTGGEQGLLGLAFHPDYSNNGFFYVNYTHDPPGDGPDVTRISRFEVSLADPDVALPASEAVLMTITQDFSNHNGGDVHFGPDGYLYIALGDGGGAQDPNARGQDLASLLGKILRIDVDGGFPYAVPANNPFVGDAGALDEIWSYGLRNPWRFSFDLATGDLFIGDVGQGMVEEIDFQPAGSAGGENYGWSCMEGDVVQDFNPCDGTPLTPPILVYDHGLGCAVTGGYRYRGIIGGLHGRYVFGDYCSGRIWFGVPDGGGWLADEWANTAFNISSFGEGEDGELHVVDLDGGVYVFTSASSVFSDGFEFGDASRWDAVTAD
jgi:glucose/arabinose dehydrogenase